MTLEEPQHLKNAKKGIVPARFNDFHQACLWAQKHPIQDFIVPSTALNENLRDKSDHNSDAWTFLQAVEKVITEDWCLMTVSKNKYVEHSAVMYYDKTRDWLVTLHSKNDFTKLRATDVNHGLRVVAEPREAFSMTFGSTKPWKDITEEDLDKWYDDEGDFLYGADVNYIKDSLKHFLSDDTAAYLVKVNIPWDQNVRTINYFFKVFEPR